MNYLNTYFKIVESNSVSEKIQLFNFLPLRIKILFLKSLNKKCNFYLTGNKELQTLADSNLKFEPTKLTESEVFNNFLPKLNKVRKTKTKKENQIILLNYIKSLPKQFQILYARVVLKQLRLGINLAILNAKKWQVQLATNWNDFSLEKQINYLKTNTWASYKIDGYRCVFYENQLKSREGVEYKNFPKVLQFLNKFVQTETFQNSLVNLDPVWNNGFVLDGEIYDSTFTKIQEIAFKTKTIQSDTYKYAVFDIIPKTEWDSKKFKLSFKKRLNALNLLKNRLNLLGENLVCEVLTQQYLPKNTEISYIEDLLNQSIKKGYEGLILKKDVPYFFDRKHTLDSMVKLKKFNTYEVKIVKIISGKGKLANTLGKIEVLGPNNTTTAVGAGFTDTLRKEIWENQNKYINKIIEISSTGLTPYNKFKNPTFIRFRDDKTIPDYN